jgi:hypothetical protein
VVAVEKRTAIIAVTVNNFLFILNSFLYSSKLLYLQVNKVKMRLKAVNKMLNK